MTWSRPAWLVGVESASFGKQSPQINSTSPLQSLKVGKERLRQCSGTTPEPTSRDETASTGDDSSADGIERDHADQQERQHHQGCAALLVAVNPCDHNRGTAD